MSRAMRRQAFFTLVLLILGLGLAYLLLVAKPGPQPQPAPELAAPRVQVVVVEPQARSIAVVTQGTVGPLQQVTLISRVAGQVEAVASSFAEGGFFQAGEELIKVEDVDYRFAIVRAESQVAAMQQRVAEERGRALQAKREWRDLGSKDANALFLRQPQLAAAEAALAAAKADLEAAQLDLKRTSISLPFNGRISTKRVDVGQYISPGAVLAEAYATEAVQLRLPLTDRQVALLDLPLTYQAQESAVTEAIPVTLEARFGNRQWRWQASIVRTDASIDVDSRVLYAVAEVRDPFAREAGSERPPLAPGLFVSATIEGRDLPDVVVLPRSALRSDDSLMLVDAENRTQARAVQVLQGDAQQVWVQGLEPGDRVIVSESDLLDAGMKVTAEETSAPTGVNH